MKSATRSSIIFRVALFVVCAAMVSSCAETKLAQRHEATDSAVALPTSTQSTDAGWAGYLQPVTGGSGASHRRTHTVRTRRELVAALQAYDAGRDEAKLIQIEGVIDLSVNDANVPLAESDYRDPAFSWEQFGRAFALDSWGKKKPDGQAELARQRSASNQEKVVVIRVGSNTTLVGLGETAVLKNGGLMLQGVENVLIRNIKFEDAYDYFPAWDPDDNSRGEWNAAYDNISVVNSRRVWIDFCTFTDGARPDRINRTLLGRPMQFHDGLIDVIRGSDLITISNSHFRNHDKGMLIGNSDARTDDAGRLRVTLHNNWFENVKERSPRVRYGQVHVYNNLYTARGDADYSYSYSIGVGLRSSIIAESNAFQLDGDQRSHIFRWLRGERLVARDNLYYLGGQWHSFQPAPPNASSSVSLSTDWEVPYSYQRSSADTLVSRLVGSVGAGTAYARKLAAGRHVTALR